MPKTHFKPKHIYKFLKHRLKSLAQFSSDKLKPGHISMKSHPL